MSFQEATGIDWKCGVEVSGAASSASLGADIDEKIKQTILIVCMTGVQDTYVFNPKVQLKATTVIINNSN